ncbi:type I-F CRISPR-associated protein Csy3 [Aliikangiella maris]|uniref:Type I-F CRISPR-associated protein Csy3 n=2 Tax=Aliikangiella maris TaxID=3162458 RepID=A0ABV2BTC4_9GAMM
MTTLKTASVLAFERKLSNSDGLMFAGLWESREQVSKWCAIKVTEKAIRGTISNRQKNAIQSDPTKLDAEVQKANLQKVDVSALPFDCDTLKVTFTLRVLGDLQTPSTCNNQDYQQALQNVITSYISENGFTELAYRYATNIASGRFLWRNRVGAEKVEVKIFEPSTEKSWLFNGFDFQLRHFDHQNEQLRDLSKAIEKGLAGDSFSFLQVEAYVKLGEGQEVFPSQELVLDSSTAKSKKSKELYSVNDTAAMHSQKIGNALRTIDSWYPDAVELGLGPISVEPFGSVTNRGKAYRQPKQKMDFYTLLDNWVIKEKKPELEQQHYVIANLIRGGVYGEKSE